MFYNICQMTVKGCERICEFRVRDLYQHVHHKKDKMIGHISTHANNLISVI